jgi:steroid 5-alpha reductase family enzyme
MNKRSITPFAGIAVAAGIAGLVALAGSHHGESIGGFRVFALCAIAAFAIQWLAFIPAYLLRTEKFFDLTGSLTYITLVVFAVVAAGNWEPRSLVLAALVLAWAVRLGSFLFRRVLQSGGDARFETMKRHLASFLLTWTLQGLWVFLTASAALAAISSNAPAAIDWTAFAGVAIWLAGFSIEVAADVQKQRFRSDPANRGQFIRSGLWAWSRHPNYFGEIVIWIGVAMVAAPPLSGWQWVTMVSPVFVTLLLTRISGIPLLERRGKQRWGNDPGYQQYLANTPVLIPRPRLHGPGGDAF